MNEAGEQGHLKELVVTIVLSIFGTVWHVCLVDEVVRYITMKLMQECLVVTYI